MLTLISLKADTFRSTGSLSMGAPGGILTEGLPPNVSARSDSGMMVASCLVSAMCAPPTARAVVPKAFDRRIRKRSPPMLGRTILRIVWFSKTGAGGRPGNGRGVWTAELHALTQCPVGCLVSVAADMLNARKTARTERTFDLGFSMLP